MKRRTTSMNKDFLIAQLNEARHNTKTQYTIIEATRPKLEVVGRVGFISLPKAYFHFVSVQGIMYEIDFDRVTSVTMSPKAIPTPTHTPEYTPSDKVPPHARKMTRQEATAVMEYPPASMTTELALLREEMPWFDQFLNTHIGCETIDTTHPNMPILRPCEVPLDHPDYHATCRLCVNKPSDITSIQDIYADWERKEIIRAFSEIEEDIKGNLTTDDVSDWLASRFSVAQALVLDDRDFLFRDKQGDVLQALRSYLINEIDRMLGL
jgi:hypothetical protein